MRTILLPILLCACAPNETSGKKADPSARSTSNEKPRSTGSAAPNASAAPPPSFDKLKVTLDGSPVKIQQALIKRLPVAGRYQLLLNDGNVSCDELLTNLFNGPSLGPGHVLVDLGNHLAADGTMTSLVTYSYRGSSELTPGSSVKVTGKADKGDKVEVTLDMSAMADKKKLEVHGSFVAEGCGDRAEKDRSGEPKAKHASTAFVTIAGKKLPIFNAIRTGKDQSPVIGAPKTRDYVLSSGPKDCSSTTPWAEVVLELRGGIWRVHGEWLAQEISNSTAPDEKTKDIKVSLGDKGKSDDGPTIELKLEGKGTVGDYPVALEGTVEAIDCPEDDSGH